MKCGSFGKGGREIEAQSYREMFVFCPERRNGNGNFFVHDRRPRTDEGAGQAVTANRLAMLAAIALGFAAAPMVRAQSTLIWTNGSDIWQSATAWNGAPAFPGAGDNAFFTNGTTYTVALTNDVLNIQSNFFSNASGTVATVTLDLGTNELNAVYSGVSPGAFLVGDKANSATTVYLASSTVPGKGLVVPARIVVGRNANGILFVTNGNVSVTTTILANGTGGHGTLVLSGSSVVWSNGGAVQIGNAPTSTANSNSLMISNSAAMIVLGAFRVGTVGGSSFNTLLLDTGGRLFTKGVSAIGGGIAGSNNTATVQGGAIWDNGGTQTFSIGLANETINNVLSIGTGSVVSNIGMVLIYPTNTLNLLDGTFGAITTTNNGVIQGFGTLSSQVVNLGLISPSGGTLTLNTTTSIVQNGTITIPTGGVLQVVGSGSVQNDGQILLAGGTMLASNMVLGSSAGAQGTLTVADGTNTLWSSLDVGSAANATGAVWVSGGQLTMPDNGLIYVGNNGVGQMTVSNGNLSVFALNVAVGTNSAGTLTISGGSVTLSNQLGVGFASATGTVWLTGGVLTSPIHQINVGYGGFGQMIVSNGSVSYPTVEVGTFPGGAGTLTIAGGTHSIDYLTVGRNAGATGAFWLTGGVLTNSQQASIGDYFSSGQMTVSNGTMLANGVAVGVDVSSQGTLTVAGGTNTFSSSLEVGALPNATGAVWVTGGQLTVTNSITYVGELGIGQMAVSNGTMLAGKVVVGFFSGSQGTLTVAGGSLVVAKAGNTGLIDARRGSMAINGGAVTVDQLFVTNGVAGSLAFNGGTLNTKSTTVNNGSIVAVGDGASVATLHLMGGIHSFANNLRIRTSAFLTGCGTITGNVLVDAGGTVLADCGTTLNFISGTFTNNGSMIATGGTVLKFYGPVVNTGLIDATGGNVQFFSTLTDNGTILTPTNSWTDGTGKWETSGNWSAGVAPTNTQAANLITNAASKTVTIDATTSGSFPSTMTIRNLNMAGAGSSTNILALSNAGFITPLHVRSQLTLSNNSAVIVNNSALQVDGGLSLGSPVGSANQLIVTNGGRLVSATTAIGGLPGFNNSVLVTGTNSVWVNTNSSLAVANSSGGFAIQIVNGAQLVATNVYLGNSATADGNVVMVTDPGSSWTNSGILRVGGTTHHTQFIVSNGATAFSANVIIGDPVGATNSALVTGSNSLWRTDGSIQVGNGGTGDTLTIAAGGALIASNATHTTQVKVDGATISIGDGTFQVDNLVVTNGGAIQYTQTYKVDNATVSVASGTVQASSNLVVASTAGATGTVNVTGGSLVVTNGALSIGNNGTITSGGGVGLMTVSNGSVLASNILIGSSAGGLGDLILANGGSISCPGGTNCLILINSLGFDQVGGDLVWVGSTLECGVTRSADYNISGGTASFQDLYIGYSNLGTMTMAGGVANISSRLTVGHLGSPVSTGVVWITGGQLTAVNNYTIIGNSGVGQMTISNGVVTVADVFIGNGSNPGTLTLAGGTLTLNNLVLPNPGSRFIFSGGWLNAQAVSNANGQIVVVGNGVAPPTLNLLGGISLFDKGLTISANATLTGFGTISGSVANFGLIRPGDGLLSFTGIVTNNGLIVTNSALQFLGGLVNNGTVLDAAKDADGDGMNNLSEVLAGTNPTNSASVFHITTVTKVGNDVQVNWSTVGGKRYVVQASTASGGYTNNFTDLSSVISIPDTGESSTSYLDVGGATNIPSRYYRVWLVP